MNRRLAVPAFIAALLAVGLASLAAALAAVWHSYYGTYPATGAMATLADAVVRGMAPGHDDGRTFLATYYFPPFPILVAAAHRLGLGWLQALRAGSLVSGLLLMVSAGWAAHALGAGRRGALLAPALVVATYTFKLSALDGRADLLAAAFSLAALAAWSRDHDARGWAVPVLAAAAVLTKATSVAVPLALVAWTLHRRRGAGLARFSVRFAACVLGGALLTLPVHGPAWYVSALHALITHASGRTNLLRGPAELVRYLGVCGELAVFTTLALMLLASRRVRETPVAAYCGSSLLITLYVMTNFGSGPNHLDELAAAAATCAAVWAAPRLSRRTLLPALALAIAVLGASWRDLVPPVRHASAPANLRSRLLDTVRAEPGEVFTEDALISIAAGRRPAVSDLDVLRSMALRGDPSALRIIHGLTRRRFGLLVLNDDLGATARWYRVIHFGDLTIGPIEDHYRKTGTLDEYHLYRPLADSVRGVGDGR